jgi:hypothetical protein
LREKYILWVLETKVLSRMCDPNKKKVIEIWRKLHTGELQNLSPLPDNTRVIETRRMRWPTNVVCPVHENCI